MTLDHPLIDDEVKVPYSKEGRIAIAAVSVARKMRPAQDRRLDRRCLPATGGWPPTVLDSEGL